MILTSNQLIIRLPWPPSVNTYWRRNGHRYFISPSGVAYRAAVHALMLQLKAETKPIFKGPIKVLVEALLPDKRIRDLDNVLKAPLDALGHTGVYADDSQIEDLHIVKVGIQKPGGLNIIITTLP